MIQLAQKKNRNVFNNILNGYKNLKQAQQLMLLISAVIGLSFLVLLISHLIHQSLLSKYCLQVSNEIFNLSSQRESRRQLGLYSYYFLETVNIDGQSLISFHQLYHITKKQVKLNSLALNDDYQMYYAGINPIPSVVRIRDGYGQQDTSYSFMCYSNITNFDEPYTKNEQIGLKIQEQLQAYGQMLYHGSISNQLFLYSYIGSEKTTSIYPCLNRGTGIYSYNVPERPWYIAIENDYQNRTSYQEYHYSFSNPFILYTDKKVGYTIGLPIVDDSLQMIGGVACNFLGDQLFQIFNQGNPFFHLIYIISDNGTMIMHPYNVSFSDLPLYIYNQSYTGFNYEDWQYIDNSTQYVSNCQSSTENLNLLCRYNSLYQKDLIIGVKYISQFKMKIIFLQSNEEYQKYQIKISNQLDSILQDSLKLFIFLLSGLILIIFLFINHYTKLIFKPIELIIDSAMTRMKNLKKITKQITFFTKKLMSSSIFQLHEACQSFFQNKFFTQFNKSVLCKNIELFKYPLNKLKSKDKAISQIRNSTVQLEEKENNNTKQQFKLKSKWLISSFDI